MATAPQQNITTGENSINKTDLNATRLANLAKARETKRLKLLGMKQQLANSVTPTSAYPTQPQIQKSPTFTVTPLTNKSDSPISSPSILPTVTPTTSTKRKKNMSSHGGSKYIDTSYESESDSDNKYYRIPKKSKNKNNGNNKMDDGVGSYFPWSTIYSVIGFIFASTLFEFYKVFASGPSIDNGVLDNTDTSSNKVPDRNNLISNQSIFR